MFLKAFGAFVTLFIGASAAAQQAQAPLTVQQLLAAGFDLKSVVVINAPCGNQPATANQACTREIYFFQSQRRDILVRCELGAWNGQPRSDCRRIG
jgi:hypothetical protein